MRLADKTLSKYTELNPNKAIDPAMIVLIVNLVSELVSMFQGCKQNPEQAQGIMNKPTLLQKIALGNILSKHVGFFNFKLKNELKEVLLSTGKSVTIEDVQEAYEEIAG